MIHKKDFMCRCNAKSGAEAQACLDRVKEELGADDSDLLTQIAYALNWGLSEEDEDENAPRYYGSIAGIDNDQWSGVAVDVKKYASGFSDVGRIYVQCDRVEDGIARAWELAKEAVAEDRNPEGAA